MNYWLQRIPVNQNGHLASGDWDPGDVRDVLRINTVERKFIVKILWMVASEIQKTS
jgi:hypothetical protein